MNTILQVAIVGGSGSGKTWLSESLSASLAPAAPRLCLDAFYRDLSHLEAVQRTAVNFDDPAAIDWDAVQAVLHGFARGEAVETPVYDFATHTRRSEVRRVTPAPVVFWDGLWLLHKPEVRAMFGHSIYVDCDAAERLARRTERDIRSRGRTADSVRRQFETYVEPMHRLFVEPQRHWATRCVTSPVSPSDCRVLLDEVLQAATTLRGSDLRGTARSGQDCTRSD